MQKTQHYQLNQWEPADGIERAAFNADNAAIDAALSAHDTAITDTNTQLAAVAAALGTGGKNCRIAWGSYTGNGKYGKNNPNSITVPFKPMVVLIGGDSGSYSMWPTVMLRGHNQCHCDVGYQSMTVTWNERGVSWYNEDSDSYQNNYSGRTYYYIALGYSEE